jgi:hypothetical protein
MAQFEREMMLERQREGSAKAKANGKYKGRKPTARLKADDAVRMFRSGTYHCTALTDAMSPFPDSCTAAQLFNHLVSGSEQRRGDPRVST